MLADLSVREINRPLNGEGIERAGAPGQAYICTIRGEFVSIHDAYESWGLHGLLVVVGDALQSLLAKRLNSKGLMSVCGGALSERRCGVVRTTDSHLVKYSSTPYGVLKTSIHNSGHLTSTPQASISLSLSVLHSLVLLCQLLFQR